MAEHFIDIRMKVDAETIHQALDKVEMIEEYIMNDDNVIDHFIKAVGISLKDRDKMVGDRDEF